MLAINSTRLSTVTPPQVINSAAASLTTVAIDLKLFLSRTNHLMTATDPRKYTPKSH